MTSELADSGRDVAVESVEVASAVSPAEGGVGRETDLPYQSRSAARNDSEQSGGLVDGNGEFPCGSAVSASGESASSDDGESRQEHFSQVETGDDGSPPPAGSDALPVGEETGGDVESGSGESTEASSTDAVPDRDLAAEAHKRELGNDPATGRYRPAEADTAVRVEEEKGIELARSADPRVDWRDKGSGETYDAVGNFPSKHFDKQWPHLQTKIADHLEKADYVPVDVSQFTPEQKQKVREFIDDNGLGPRAFLVGQ